jgi:hypothetical protein
LTNKKKAEKKGRFSLLWAYGFSVLCAATFSSDTQDELPVACPEMLGHLLLLEHLLQDGLHALTDPGLYVQLDVMLELMLLLGQVPPFSLETHNLPDTSPNRLEDWQKTIETIVQKLRKQRQY